MNQLPVLSNVLFISVTVLFIHLWNFAYSDIDSAEIIHGERLFSEHRFSEKFFRFVQGGGKYNQTIDKGDPQLDKTYRFFGLPPYQIPFIDSPFKGSTFSCRTCHMVDEHVSQKELGMRSYADFSSKSPVSSRSDNQLVTIRNSPVLVSSMISKKTLLLHADGEFSTPQELILGTLTGRNFGWLPEEKQIAIKHICNVIKHDNGENHSALEFGRYSYKEIFMGTKDGKKLPEEYLLNKKYIIDVNDTSCNQILINAANLIEKYITDLQFAKENVALSPYDTFLQYNNIPKSPNIDETDLEYSQRVLKLIIDLKEKNKLKYVYKNSKDDREHFRFHDQEYKFKEKELEGLKIFFNNSIDKNISNGNCISCHPAPHFTDFKFHNIGISQVEYEAIHGLNTFNDLPIPSLSARTIKSDIYLPATNMNPTRRGIFRKPASNTQSLFTDLGAWNILFNDDFPNPQNKLYKMFCDDMNQCQNKDVALQRSLAAFKTPTLRNLGHSAPYMHNGQISDLHAVLGFYINASINSRNGYIRNADKEVEKIKIKTKDIDALSSFLISLYEDYH